jgi:hypothetical protein
MEVVVPPELVSQGRLESGVPGLSGVERRSSRNSDAGGHVVVALCITAETIEVLGAYADVGRVDEEPSGWAVKCMEAANHLPIVVQ